MDGLPRLPAVSLCMKKSDFVPELQPLKRYIEVQYQQSSSLFNKEFSDFLSLRKDACEPSIDYTGLSGLKRYYAQLQLLKGRFHFSPTTCTDVTWKQDILSSSYSESSDIRFEEASVLYNVAALHSILGVKEKRGVADSMKIACTHFQCSAWALNTLAERHLPLSGVPDLNNDLMLLFGSIMLVQAQECVVEKSILDNRPANVTAKLTQYIVDVYEDVSAQLLASESNNKIILPKFCKDWYRRCQIKTSFYSALVAYYAGINEEENKAYGKAIAWFQLANNHIEDCKTTAKSFKDSDNSSMMIASSGTFRASANFAGEVILNKLTSSTKDNDFIYHELVPKVEMLEQIKGVCIVKGVPFDHNDPEVRGLDIFHRLIPMNVEMKASLLRNLTGEVDLKEEELDKFLSTLYLDPTTMLEVDPPLPQTIYNLFARMDAVERDPGLVNLSVDVDSEIESLSIKIKDVEECFTLLVTTKGNERTRNLSIIMNNLKERFKNLSDANQQAKQSNGQLRDSITNQLQSFDILKLSLEEFVTKLPSVNGLLTVSEMRQQRHELISQLRTALHIDDVDSDLLIISNQNKEDLNDWFENRLKTKHDNLVNIIKQNLSAQENIQSALIDLNAEFAPTWEKLSEARTKRSEQINNILVAGESFDGILSKSKQGVDFYHALIDQLKDIDKEVDQLVEDLNKQLRSSMDEFSKSSPIKDQTIGTAPPLPAVSKPLFPTLGDYMQATRSPIIPNQPNMYMGPIRWPVHTSNQSYPQLNLPANPVTVSSLTPTSFPLNQPVSSRISSPSPNAYYKPTHTNQPFPYPPTQPPFRGLMTSIPVYNAQQFPTGVNIQSTSVSVPASSYAPGFSTSPPIQLAVRPSPTVTYYGQSQTADPLIPPYQKPNASFPQSFSQPNNSSNIFESVFIPNNFHTPNVLPSITSLPQFSMPVNNQSSQPNNFIQAPIHPTKPSIPSNYSSLNPNQFPPQSIWPNQPMNNNRMICHNPRQDYSMTVPTQNLSADIQHRPLNPPITNTLSYQQPISYANSYPVYSGSISFPSQPCTTLPNQNHYIHSVSNPTTYIITTPSITPTPVPQSYYTPQHPEPISPIEPQVLTKADLDAKRREERLREAYSANQTSQQLASISTSDSAELSSSKHTSSTISSKSNYPSLNSAESDSSLQCELPKSSSVTTKFVNDRQPVAQLKFQPPELLSDPLVLNRFIASAELLLTWLKNPNELISTSEDNDFPIASPTNSISRLNKAWQKVQTIANAFTTSVYFNGKRPTQAAALCCPTKNRNQNFVPYDNNRVVITSLKNDYINASHIDFQNNLGEWCPRYIITQAPMIKTVIDFWTMILEQGCEVVVMLVSPRVSRTGISSFSASISSCEGTFSDEEDPLRVPAHLPMNKTGAKLSLPGSNLEIRLQAIKDSYMEGNPIPQNSDDVIVDANDSSPVVCEYGAELSGIFVTASVGILHAETLGRMSDVFTIAGYLCQQRRGVLNNSCQLYAAARLIGYSAIETAAKKDVVIGPRHRPSSSATAPATTIGVNGSNVNALPNSTRLNMTSSPLDNIFSKQSLRLDDLISVVDKWSIPDNNNNNKSESRILDNDNDVGKQPIINESYVSHPSTTVSSSSPSDNHCNTLSQSLIRDEQTLESQLPDHLVNLNNLTKNSTQNKRFTRQDFEDISTSTITTQLHPSYRSELDSNDPLNKLDPLWNANFRDHPVNS
ncbi:Tyrosine-protein phosphatase non-receptor type 23 [Schistosoma japonicum]|nr:Tyrosine-protein phosphatase non-receptor type 23 [Schistosoma japonicum]